jgi:phytoene desaturase (3,4-didehydrolycopene-forming)
MLSFQDLYVGLSPYEAPAVFSLLQALEFDAGIYYPTGGFTRIAHALESIAIEYGVEIKTDHEVTACQSEQKKMMMDHVDTLHVKIGSQTEIQSMKADIIVINQDVGQAEVDLIAPNMRDKRAVNSRPSCGIISLSFGFNTSLTPLQHHNILFSRHYKDSWNTVAYPDTATFDPSCFNCYVHAPSRTDTSCCPPGHDAITVLVPVPPLTASTDEMRYNISEIREAVLARLQNIEGMPQNLRSYIAQENIRDPISWRQEFGLFRGSAFGLAHSIDQLSLLRPRFKHPHYSNVFRVGASTRPGNGVPLVMIGARLASDAIINSLE